MPERGWPAHEPARMRESAQSDQYRFLVGDVIDADTLVRATAEAVHAGVLPHHIMIARGWLTEGAYLRALSVEISDDTVGAAPLAGMPARSCSIDAIAAGPAAVAAEVASARARGDAPLLLGRDALDWIEPPEVRLARAHAAAHGLRIRRPGLSAARRIASWQLIVATAALGAVAGGLIVAPADTLVALAGIVTVPFLFVVGLRVVALALLLTRRAPRAAARAGRGERARILDADLPVYSIMVPMFRETEVLPDLVAGLAALDYPPAKLDILLVLESVDEGMRRAARRMVLPGNFRVIVVPDVAPRTKPKAINYAFEYARGDYVVVFDAEDEPEPDQLRRALAMFWAGPSNLACVQARLNLHNARATWLTRQFTLEYTALFDALLPALVRLGLPVPLGGTSNHFPAHVLRQLGGWDPHNVTEDADLGLRIARGGGLVAVLDSTTWEEAPPTLGIWVRQRTRWLKGFMQTWLVHMRDPWRLYTDLGLVGFLGFQAFLGGIILSVLIHPIFVALLLADIATGDVLAVPETSFGMLLLGLATFNLVAGYGAGMLIAGVAVTRRGWPGLVLSVGLMPLYWIMISLTAYRALWQLIVNPYLWEKTPHRQRRRGDRGGLT